PAAHIRTATRASDDASQTAIGPPAGGHALDVAGAVAHASAASATNSAPPLPWLPDRGSAIGAPGAAGGAGLTGLGLVAALVALSLLAAPRLGRRLRPAPGRRASPAFVFLLE